MHLPDTGPAPLHDTDLVERLRAFRQMFVELDHGAIHLVRGGKGPPLYLLPSWPMTWWEYHAVMPVLATRFTVVAIDLRGMGASDRPGQGYDKKTMADDIVRVMNALGHAAVHVAGSDIGSMVGYALAATHPARVLSLTMVEAPHPYPAMMAVPLFPDDDAAVHPWWMAFHGLDVLSGSSAPELPGLVQAWLFARLAGRADIVRSEDMRVFANAYKDDDAIGAALGWVRAFPRDMADFMAYPTVSCPVLGLGGRTAAVLGAFLTTHVPVHRLSVSPTPGHWLAYEEPTFFAHEVATHIARA